MYVIRLKSGTKHGRPDQSQGISWLPLEQHLRTSCFMQMYLARCDFFELKCYKETQRNVQSF